jgi:Flp pilus assembly protein TadD
MRADRLAALARAALVACAVALVAPRLGAQATLLARADSAFAAEDRALARSLYEEVLRADPAQSRAVFRLAQLESKPERSLALFRRYCALQPRDAWGHMAEGDQLARMGRTREALEAYDRAAALAPDERDVAMGRARVLQRGGRSTEAQLALASWTARHPEDAEAWDLLGREQMRAGRPRLAARSFERVGPSSPVRGVDIRLRAARAVAAPALEPIGTLQRDSDGNATRIAGLRGDVHATDGLRLGAGVRRALLGDGTTDITSTSVFGTLDARPAPGARLTLEGGARSFAAFPGATAWTQPEVDARLRLRAASRGPALELRAQHLPLGGAPILVTNRVTRSEVRANLDLPVGALRLRPAARGGVVRASLPPLPWNPSPPLPPTGRPARADQRTTESITRVGFDAAVALPLTTAFEVSGQYHALSYDTESVAGYFAPRIAETVESGVYLDVGGDGPVSLAADLGAGAQRVARQGEDVGRWEAAFRAWTYVAIPFRAGRALWAEIEAYDAPFAPAGVATSDSWRYVAVSVGLRWSLR